MNFINFEIIPQLKSTSRTLSHGKTSQQYNMTMIDSRL